MLPVRDGVGASQVGLPEGPWACMLDFLVQRFPAIPAAQWRERMARGDVVDEAGRRITPGEPYTAHGKLYYYRSVPDEEPSAAPVSVLFEDELLVVADKPHFLSVTPSGHYLQQTLLVQLRRQLGLDGLTPLHRLDRETAGVVLLAKQPATCALYHRLFFSQGVTKTYEAIAARPDGMALQFPLTRASTLVEGEHFMQMREAGGEVAGEAVGTPNASTRIEWLETRGAHARYRLWPATGKRHQLRVHMAALGLPILGDRIYPRLLPHGSDDPANPLRLLAQAIAFRDPVTGQARSFASRQRLDFPQAPQADVVLR
ncbi:MAG: pseudouridine synthase [Proteobacteria bacterium]|jgi:tRNA pseudouridine32 synthase/23S rRNA pseudouridine746 synthase|nr:pseudouridine synthase [Ramlibacter sp.]MCA0212969.1 pseudouridine synthase [Pseudomonadota bacterium]